MWNENARLVDECLLREGGLMTWTTEKPTVPGWYWWR